MGSIVRGTPLTKPEVGEVWLKPCWMEFSRPVTMLKTAEARPRSPALMPPGNLSAVMPLGLAELVPRKTRGTTVL